MKIHQTFVKIDENSPKIYENSLKSIKSMKIHQKCVKFMKIDENSSKNLQTSMKIHQTFINIDENSSNICKNR